MVVKKSEIRALVRRLVGRTRLTWDEPRAVIDNLAKLHDELKILLESSGLYSKRESARLMAEADLLLLRHAREIGALARAAQIRAWQRGRENFEDVLGTFEVGFVKGLTGAENELAAAYLTTDRITQVTEEMRALIRQQVLSGLFLEKTPYEVMAYITQVLGIRDQRGFRQIGTTGVSAKAERILRTELMTIQNAGAWEARQQALTQFPDMQEVWMATGDKRTRDSHIIAHGQVKKDGYFTVGGHKARFPADPLLPIRERANCRCTTMVYREEWGTVDEVLGPLAGLISAERERRKENFYHREHRVHGVILRGGRAGGMRIGRGRAG